MTPRLLPPADAGRSRLRAHVSPYLHRAAAALALGVTCLLHAAPAQAGTIVTPVTSTIAPQSLDDPGVYPTQETIGTFAFAIPAYGTLLDATVSGLFGNNVLSPDTAPGIYSVGGITVFTCNVGDPCWGSATETAWTYTFTAAQLDQILGANDGAVLFSVLQTGGFNVQTDTTTLTLDYAIPETGSAALLGAALLALGLLGRRSRA